MSKNKKEGVKTYVGNSINQRQFKRFLAMAKPGPSNCPKGNRTGEKNGERAALKSFVLGPDVQYFPKEEKTATTAADAVEAAIKGKKAQ